MKRKTITEIIIHILFWLFCFYYFINNSYLRYHSFNMINEYCSIILIIVIIYINYFYYIPKFFKLPKLFKYFLSLFLSILIITFIEFLLIKNDVLFLTSNEIKKVQNSVLFWNFFGIFFRDTLFVAFFTMFKIYRDAIKSYRFLQDKTDLERTNLINQIEMVKSRINTHFLLNTLHSIHAMSIKKSDKTPEALDELRHLLKYIVVDSDDVMISIKKEIDFLKNYIELEKIRKPNVNLNFSIEGDTDKYLVPPMIFESFVNNAFKYNDYLGNGLIDISIVCKGKDVLFTCKNAVDKRGAVNVNSTGKGLINTNMRLNLHYKGHHTLQIDDNEKYYMVSLLLKGRF